MLVQSCTSNCTVAAAAVALSCRYIHLLLFSQLSFNLNRVVPVSGNLKYDWHGQVSPLRGQSSYSSTIFVYTSTCATAAKKMFPLPSIRNLISTYYCRADMYCLVSKENVCFFTDRRHGEDHKANNFPSISTGTSFPSNLLLGSTYCVV